MAASVNITDLQQGSRYDVMVSPYIEGFQLGPPTTIIINTLSLGRMHLLYTVILYSYVTCLPQPMSVQP